MTSFVQKTLVWLCILGIPAFVSTPVWAKGPHSKAVRSCPRYSGKCPRTKSGSMSHQTKFEYQYKNADQNSAAQMKQNQYMYKYNQEGAQEKGPKIYRYQRKSQQEGSSSADIDGTN